METERCDKCRYFSKSKQNKSDPIVADLTYPAEGECRVLPPIVLDDSDGWGIFPKVLEDDWCGEFMDREE